MVSHAVHRCAHHFHSLARYLFVITAVCVGVVFFLFGGVCFFVVFLFTF